MITRNGDARLAAPFLIFCCLAVVASAQMENPGLRPALEESTPSQRPQVPDEPVPSGLDPKIVSRYRLAMQKALISLRNYNFEDALRELNEADAAVPNNESVKQARFGVYYQWAFRLHDQRDFQQALTKLEIAEEIIPGRLVTANLRGTVYLRMGQYNSAWNWFARAQQLDPQQFAPYYNLAEVLFFKKDWAKARERYAALEEPFAGHELMEIVRYKVFLCDLMAGETERARREMAEFSEFSEMPTFYFAQAAWHFKHDDPQRAREWLRDALLIYPRSKIGYFAPSLEIPGWVTDSGEDKLGLFDQE